MDSNRDSTGDAKGGSGDSKGFCGDYKIEFSGNSTKIPKGSIFQGILSRY